MVRIARLTPENDAFQAIRDGNRAKLTLLIESGTVQVNKIRWSGWTLLHRAAELGRTDMCEFLLDRGALVNARKYMGMVHSVTCVYRQWVGGHVGVFGESRSEYFGVVKV